MLRLLSLCSLERSEAGTSSEDCFSLFKTYTLISARAFKISFLPSFKTAPELGSCRKLRSALGYVIHLYQLVLLLLNLFVSVFWWMSCTQDIQ